MTVRKNSKAKNHKVVRLPKAHGHGASRENFNIFRTLRTKLMGPDMLITNEKLLDFLSEFLAVEKGGTKLYTAALERSSDPEMREVYQNFLTQTKEHARILTRGIKKLGGDVSYMSPGAIAQERIAETLLGLKVPPELRELKDAENLLLAETKDHADWEFLAKIKSMVGDEAKELLHEMVAQVEDQEDEHLDFAKKAVEKLALRVAFNQEDGKSDRMAA